VIPRDVFNMIRVREFRAQRFWVLIGLAAFAIFIYGESFLGLTQQSARGRHVMKLPETIGSWQLDEGPQRIEAAGIFDYMNGAGELYIGYRFRHLDAYQYSGPADSRIQTEIYQMESSDDAFGLLSLDWGGEPVELPSAAVSSGHFPRALYGAGLLRIWSGDIYARVLAETDLPATRAAVLQLGRAIAHGRPAPSTPALLKQLPEDVSGYRLLESRVSYFRSYLVLNSIYFLSTENILRLGLEDEAVTALFQSGSGPGRKTVRLVRIHYGSEDRAGAAARSFIGAYFNEKPASQRTTHGAPVTGLVEDGWVGLRSEGRDLVLVFECADRQTALEFLETAL
jgi:hypothetical protein